MESNFGICKNCAKQYVIVNKKYYLCQNCNYKRLHKGKTEYEVSIEKKKLNPIIKVQATGESELFKEIWKERPNICVHCKRVLHKFNIWYFAHIKPKSTHPKLRLDKNNIRILCVDCHFSETNNSKEIFDKRKNLYIND